MLKLSVITVTRNSSRWLDEAIASVVTQDGVDLEYIIVDGASTDGTIDIIRSHAARDSRIRWISEPDGGISEAFNKGLALATGEVVGILNSDDTYEPQALAAVAEASAVDPGADVFHGNLLKVEDGRPVFTVVPAPIENIIFEMPLNHPATFVTRRGYERAGVFDPAMRLAMDYDLMLRLYRAGCRFRHIDRVLARMRYGGESDLRFIGALKEVYRVSIREGCPEGIAATAFAKKAAAGLVKLGLRRLGMHRLLKLHPRFK